MTMVVRMLAPKMVTINTKARRLSEPLITALLLPVVPVSSSPLLVCRRVLRRAGRGRFWSKDDICDYWESVALQELNLKRAYSLFRSPRNRVVMAAYKASVR